MLLLTLLSPTGIGTLTWPSDGLPPDALFHQRQMYRRLGLSLCYELIVFRSSPMIRIQLWEHGL